MTLQTASLAAGRNPVSKHADLVYSSMHGRELLADLYLPEGAKTALPVIVWLHGGGWRLGDKRLGPNLSRFFAERGFAMVSIDYRLSGEALFPAQVIDVKAAVRWIRSVAGRYSLDGKRIGLWGSSSGGHLAACAALAGPDEFESGEHDGFSSTVEAVVDGYGPVDFLQMEKYLPAASKHETDRESQAVMKAKPVGDADSFESLLIGSPVYSAPEAVRRANPISYMRPGAPPFLILHGQSDILVPWQQSRLLFDALEAAGNDATLLLMEKLGHGFLNNSRLNKVDCGRITLHRSGQNAIGSEPEPSSFGFHTIEAFFRKHLCA